MQYFYSRETGGFYNGDLRSTYERAGSWPQNAVEISAVIHAALMAAIRQGKIIKAGDDGMPVAVDPPPPAREDLLAAHAAQRDARLRNAAEKIATLQDSVDLDMATDADREALTAWRRYRVLLNRVDINNPIWPEEPEAIN